MDTIEEVFETRAVAFLDILGFKVLTKEAETNRDRLSDLSELRTILDSHVKFDNKLLSSSVPNEMKPRYIFISDSIIMSVPLQHDIYDGLVVIVIKATQIANKLLEIGYLLRGGIAVGPVWHDNSNIFGTGYIDAVNAEKEANHPRIILTENAVQHWNNSTHFGISLPQTSLCIKYHDAMIVDTLCQEYVSNEHIWSSLEDIFTKYRNHIINNLQKKIPGSPERGKWEWIAAFFNRAVSQYKINVQPFIEFPFPQH